MFTTLNIEVARIESIEAVGAGWRLTERLALAYRELRRLRL